MTEITNLSDVKNNEFVTDYEQLSVRCDEINLDKERKEARKIILALKTYLREHKDILAISAIQLGFTKRIICMNFNGDIRTFVNPIISNSSELQLSRETCRSVPGEEYLLLRSSTIELTYQTPTGKIMTVELVGVASQLMQHHLDHLDGILISDIGLMILEGFDEASEEEKAEVIKMYLDSLDMTAKELDKAVQEDPETKQIADAIRFMESVRKGETIIESIPVEEQDEEIEESDNEE